MRDSNEPNLTGKPGDFGSRKISDEETEREEHEEQRTADGEPRVERGTADSALGNGDERKDEP